MPRHVTDRSVAPEELVAPLSRELKNPQQTIQPIILEDYTPQSGARRVRVIWDCWADVDHIARSSVILKAYEEAFGGSCRDEVKLAMGLTPHEAKAVGLLPYEILPARSNGTEGQVPQQYWKEMVDLGAFTSTESPRPHLRFATLEDAEAAYLELVDRLPGSRWVIQHDTSLDE